MSDNILIHTENLGKEYRLGEFDPHRTFRESLRHWVAAPLRRALCKTPPGRSADGEKRETIWALRDLSLDVAHGEALGIIGRNGAGKSTLLKILSKITQPTTGRAEIRGRVGSLLEVGTGFHPELTGRENVFFNGAILGMTRAEIRRKFDEIVAFSGVEKFLDTPIKRYSSGMSVRLAFAVAAHLEPEILVVDEVLAVGDAEFRRKCMSKMELSAGEGRTILFVSHNLEAITTLCNRCILLDAGGVMLDGEPVDVVAKYLSAGYSSVSRGERVFTPAAGLPLSMTAVRTLGQGGETACVFPRTGPVVVELDVNVATTSEELLIALDVRNAEQQLLFRTHSFQHAERFAFFARRGSFPVRCTLPANLLPPGLYHLGIITAIAGRKELQSVPDALEFEIVQDELLGGRFVAVHGLLTPNCTWDKEP